MNNKILTRLNITLVLCCIILIFSIRPTVITKDNIIRDTIYINNNRVISLDEIKDMIKSNEGFSSTIYKCPAGKPTIGYGHLVTNKDIFTYISRDKAELLLIKDFTNSIFDFLFSTNLKITEYNKVIAISHFIYCFGITKFNSSTLKKNIMNNKPIDEEIVQWININKRPNKKLLKTRINELEIYNGTIK